MNKARQLFACGALMATVDASAATFTVTSTNDNGAGTLRQAILDANASPGVDVIAFSIVTAGLTISPTNALPPITDPVTLDGTTQPGFSGVPVVELNGLSAGANVDGVRIWAGNSTIRGLIINRFTGDGIEIATNGNNAIERCFIGLDAGGTVDRGNTFSGIFITNSANNRIGGTNSLERNAIAGNNQNGVLIQALGASGNVILGNFIGLNATGGVAVANGVNGVFINGAPSNTVGGVGAGARNVISGNSQSGVRLEGTNAFGGMVAGNFIGLDQTGFIDVGNSQHGVIVFNSPSNTIGGATAPAGNVISGNNQSGLRLDGVSARGTRIHGNLIGTDASGQLARGNSSEGAGTQNNASFNSIGGTNVGEANLIAFNGGDGVFIAAGTNNVVRANAIHSNGGLGIDLGADGKLANDAGDADSGANALQNYPVLTAATNTPGGLVVFGTLNSRPSATYSLDFYSSSLCDPSTNGEGQVYLGSLPVTTGADSNATFNVALPAAVGRFITATATDTNGNTSEFSTCLAAQSTLPPALFVVSNTNDSGSGSLRQAIERNNLAVTSARNTIVFGISGADPLVITPLSPLPTPTEPVAIDGYSQPGASANTLSNGNNAVVRIRLDGASAGSGADGLRLTYPGMLVRGLSITRFASDGIEVSTNGNQTIEGCFIGLDTDGANVLGNGVHGVHLNGTAFNSIGGSVPAQRNVISGNGQNGVHVTGGNATNNFIAGNFIGTDGTGTRDRGNGGDGVNLNNAPRNAVGSVVAGDGNLISGNNNDGIDLNGASTTNNLVVGNLIGTDASGTLALGNSQNGVAFNSNARLNTVGMNVGGGGNVMAFNGNIGVALGNGTNNAINANRIFGNGALGIDLGFNGVTANDTGDADTGPNQLQNFPMITSGTIHPASVAIGGTLNSRPGAGYTLDFFTSLACDASGHGEGQQFLGSTSVTTDGSGNAAFNVTLPAVPVGRYLAATATDTNGNTSEFSACFAASSTLPPVTLSVVNTNDAGPGSLRQALLEAGNFPSGGPNVIAFNIPGAGPHTIMPLSQLPTPAEPVDLNGYTQRDASPNTLSNGFNAVIKIRLDFASVSGFGVDGLRLRAGRSIVRGLAILRLNNNEGIDIAGGDSNRVTGCLIGIDVDGSDKHLNSTAILINSAGNEVGGLTPADRNVISYNWTYGVAIQGAAASNNLVRGNFLGTDLAGTTNRGNLAAGVNITDAPFNLLGGPEPGARNIIGGNATGVTLTGGGSWSNRVQGNYIGSDVTGTLRLGDSSGVVLSSASSNLIGGATLAARNLIGGHRSSAISIAGGGANIVQGNLIGPSVTGATNLLNVGGIILSSGTTGNLIGGTNAGEGNTIAYNSHTGVLVNDGLRNAIRGNSIHGTEVRFGQTGLGIDLGFPGVTTNDLGDGDAGANQLQNFPIVTAASANAGGTSVQGTLNSAASQVFHLDFFANPLCDPGGNGEGQFYLGSASVVTDGGGNAGFNLNLPVSAAGRFITATATDAQGNTSEFSPCYEATLANPPMTFTVTTTNDAGPGSLRQAIIDSNSHVSSQNNTIRFNIPGSGVRVIRLASVLPAFVQPVTIDGFSQPGASANTLPAGNNAVHLIELNGSAVGTSGALQTGLRFNVPGLVVRGLRLGAFSRYGIDCVSSNGVIAGNLIYSNGFGGLLVSDSRGHLIGGATPADRNVISANNGGYGIEIAGAGAQANRVLGNFIGTDVAGAMGWGTQQSAVSISLGSDNQLGGANPGEGNVMAFHAYTCVHIQSGTNNSVRGNRIFGNAELGIDLGFVGLTPNDPGDADDGANHLQNFPIITNALASPGSILIQGGLDSRPNTSYALDFFSSAGCDFGGHGEGEFYLGSGSVMTDAGGMGAFSVNLPVALQGSVLTVTATDPAGNTSEFSPCFTPTINLPGQTFIVTNTADSGPGSLREALLASSATPSSTPDQIAFNIPGAGVRLISLLTPLPVPANSVVIDGFTQPGSLPNTSSSNNNATHLIQLDGAQLSGGGFGLAFTSASNTVRGLSLTRFSFVALDLGGAGGNLVEGCRIGLTPAGLPGGNDSGIVISSPGNRLGGTNLAALNVIAANNDYGVVISGNSASNNVVIGNRIGLEGPTNRLGHGRDGVVIAASHNRIGGSLAEGNLIAFNQRHGVSVQSGLRNFIQGNLIFGNGNKPISIAPGANGGIQPPVLTAALRGSVRVQGTYRGEPNTTYELEVQAHEVIPFAFGGIISDDRFYDIGRFFVTTDAMGEAQYDHLFPVTVPGGATDVIEFATCPKRGTSEYSQPAILFPANAVDLRMDIRGPFFGQPGVPISFTGLVSNVGPTPANDTIVNFFSPPGMVIQGIQANGPVVFNGNIGTVSGLDLPPGGSEQIVFTGSGNFLGTLPVTARADSPFPEFNPDNNFAGWEPWMGTVGSGADVGVRISSSFPTDQDFFFPVYSVAAGQSYTFTVTVTNAGQSVASNVAVDIILGRVSGILTQEITVVSARGGSVRNFVEFADCFIRTLLPGQSVDIEVTVKWTGETGYDPSLSSEPATLEVIAKSDSLDYNTLNNTETAAVLVNRRITTLFPGLAEDTIDLTWPAATAPGELLSTTSVTPPVTWQPVPQDRIFFEFDYFRHTIPLNDPGTPPQQFFRFPLVPETLPRIDVSQLTLNLGGTFLPHSDWGRLNLRHRPEAQLQFANFSFNDDWVIQNVPLVPHAGTGVVQETSFSFPLDVFGTLLATGRVGFSLTLTQALAAPPSDLTVPVLPETAVLAPGESDGGLFYFPAVPLVGGAALNVALNPPLFPNREQRRNECVVAGLANSLEYLNARHNLGIDPAKISVDKLKEAVQWFPGGAPVGVDKARPLWATRKDAYLMAENLPVVTEITTDPARVQQALNESCNIEIRATGHAASLRAMMWMGGTRYVLVVSHDLRQGQAGGTVVEPIIYDAATGDINGSVWTNGRRLTAFVIECPKPL